MLTPQQHSVLILGLGASGLAMARWCVRHGAEVTVADTREAPARLDGLRRELPAVRFVHGEPDAALLRDTAPSLVLRSPGLMPVQVAGLTSAANAAGIHVFGELELFAQALAELDASGGYRPKVLAVTGTNGKTTVTALAGQLVDAAKRQDPQIIQSVRTVLARHGRKNAHELIAYTYKKYPDYAKNSLVRDQYLPPMESDDAEGDSCDPK